MNEVSIAGLAGLLSEGETVFLSGSSGEPQELTQRLVDEPGLARGVTFVHSFVPGINGRDLAGATRNARVFFMQPAYASSHAAGHTAFLPLNYQGIGQYLASPSTPLDTLIVQVSPPDASGLCRTGTMGEFLPSVLSRPVRVLGIVNPNVPALPASLGIPMDRFAAMARSDAPLVTYDAGRSNPVTDRIVAHLAAMIPDGATVEVGVGKVPAQLLPALRGRRGLRIHGGLISDALLELPPSGCLDPDAPITGGIAVGSTALYSRLHELPRLRLVGVDITHGAVPLAQVGRLHAVNSALEVDLLGQVNAQTLGGRSVSGPGGLPDFAAAAHRDPEGLSIIALPSTDPAARISRIVARFASDTPVAVASHDVDAVVTEHGVAYLRGVDTEERRRRIAAVAHPDFRDGLK